MDIGRICYKMTGRNAAEKVVIVETHTPSQVSIVGAQTKKQPCNIFHLWPTEQVVKISKGADQKEVIAALKKK